MNLVKKKNRNKNINQSDKKYQTGIISSNKIDNTN